MTRPRWLAVLLALVFVPLAFLYLRRPRRALAYVALVVTAFAAALAALTQGWPGVASALLLGLLAVKLYGVWDAWRHAAIALPTQSLRPTPAYAIITVGSAALFLLGATRAFIGEPYRIPSSSMAPGLQRGDLVLVRKWGYGNYGSEKMLLRGVRFNHPARGDVMVFLWPDDVHVHYVKRVIGLPGDALEYRDKRLTINGVAAQYTHLSDAAPQVNGSTTDYVRESETLPEIAPSGGRQLAQAHEILLDPTAASIATYSVKAAALRHCRYDPGGFRCTIPDGHYFMLGDNRDSSNDSRYWGVVAENLFVGKVVWQTSFLRRADK